MKKNNAAALAAAAMALAVTLGPARAADVPRVSYGAAALYRRQRGLPMGLGDQ